MPGRQRGRCPAGRGVQPPPITSTWCPACTWPSISFDHGLAAAAHVSWLSLSQEGRRAEQVPALVQGRSTLWQKLASSGPVRAVEFHVSSPVVSSRNTTVSRKRETLFVLMHPGRKTVSHFPGIAPVGKHKYDIMRRWRPPSPAVFSLRGAAARPFFHSARSRLYRHSPEAQRHLSPGAPRPLPAGTARRPGSPLRSGPGG